MQNIKRYAMIFAICLLLSFLFIYLDTNGKDTTWADPLIYYTIADNIKSGHGFSDSIVPPYLPTMSREPLYPAFLAILLWMFGKNILVIQIVQAILYAITCIVIFKLGSILLPEKKRQFIIALLIAIFPTLPSYTPYLLTEVLFSFLLAIFVLALTMSMQKNSLKWYFFSGALLGITVLCKSVLALFFIFFLPIFTVINYKKYHRFMILNFTMAIILLLSGYALVIAPWIIRNHIIFKKSAIALRGFNSLYIRAEKVNINKDEVKMYGVYCFSEYLAGKLYPNHNLTSIASGYFYEPLLQKIEKYKNIGLSQEKAEDMFKKEALDLIRGRPIKFIFMGFFETIKLNSFSHILLLNNDRLKNKYATPLIKGLLKLLGFFIFIVAVAGIFSYSKISNGALVLSCLIIYFNVVYFFLDSIGRYAVPIIPYYIFFCMLQMLQFKAKNERS